MVLNYCMFHMRIKIEKIFVDLISKFLVITSAMLLLTLHTSIMQIHYFLNSIVYITVSHFPVGVGVTFIQSLCICIL